MSNPSVYTRAELAETARSSLRDVERRCEHGKLYRKLVDWSIAIQQVSHYAEDGTDITLHALGSSPCGCTIDARTPL